MKFRPSQKGEDKLTTKDREAIDRIMKGLKCTEAEAIEVYKSDCAIDKGEAMPFDLPKEKQKIVKQYTQTGARKPTVYKFEKRERKANPTKGGIIAELAEFLSQNSNFAVENVEILNKERQISFKIGEETFEVTLVQKRKPKN